MKYHYIYQTTNQINGKIYIGKHSANSLQNTYLGSGTHLKHAIKKHGKENFTKEILMILHTERAAYLWESIIVDHSFIVRTDTYNMKCGGRGGMTGWVPSPETRLKASKSKSGVPKPSGFGKRISEVNKGKRLSDECKAKLSTINTGKKQSLETIAKKTAAIRGRKHSEETKRKMSEARRRGILERSLH